MLEFAAWCRASLPESSLAKFEEAYSQGEDDVYHLSLFCLLAWEGFPDFTAALSLRLKNEAGHLRDAEEFQQWFSHELARVLILARYLAMARDVRPFERLSVKSLEKLADKFEESVRVLIEMAEIMDLSETHKKYIGELGFGELLRLSSDEVRRKADMPRVMKQTNGDDFLESNVARMLWLLGRERIGVNFWGEAATLTNLIFDTEKWDGKRVENTVGRWRKTVVRKDKPRSDQRVEHLNKLWRPTT